MKTLGVIGGMGPMATVNFFEKIVELTSAKKDQDHIPILIYNNTQIPDRSAYLLADGQSPVEALIETAKKLENMGADFLAMPCNTAHYFYEEMVKDLEIPLLNMIDLSVEELMRVHPKKVCVLGTKGTLCLRLYQDKLDQASIPYYELNNEEIELVNSIIYDIVKKNTYPKDIEPIRTFLDDLRDNKEVDYFLLACTELPIFFSHYQLSYKVIDPTEILASACIYISKNEKDKEF